MNVTAEKIDNVSGIITVNIEEADYQEKVTKDLKAIGKTHSIDGFRKGQVPTGILKKMFGKKVLLDVINRETYDALIKYIEDNKLNILGEPIIDKVKEIDFDKDKDFTFKFEVGYAPEINVTVDKKTKIPYYFIEVDQKMVDAQSENFDKRFGKQVPGEEVDETALVKGSMVELNEDGSVKEDGVKVDNTIVSPQHFTDEEQKKLFAGKKVKDTVVFNPAATCNGNITEMASMLNVDKAQADIKSNFSMEISEIIVLKKAEHNQELYDSVFGKDQVKSEEEYVEKLKQLIANQLINDSNYRFTIDTEDVLRKAAGKIELPIEFLKKWLLVKNPGKYTEETVGEEVNKMIPSLEWQLIKETVMRQLDVKVEEKDVVAVAKIIAAQQFAQYGMNNVPDETLEKYAGELASNKNYREELVRRAVEEKFYAAVRATATVEEKTITAEEFNNLFK